MDAGFNKQVIPLKNGLGVIRVFWAVGGIAMFPASEGTERSLCHAFQARTRLCFDAFYSRAGDAFCPSWLARHSWSAETIVANISGFRGQEWNSISSIGKRRIVVSLSRRSFSPLFRPN